MNLFKKKPEQQLKYCKNLLYLDDQKNIRFSDFYNDLEFHIPYMLRTFAIFDDEIYIKLYNDYQKYYKVYDIVPNLMYYRFMYFFSLLYSKKEALNLSLGHQHSLKQLYKTHLIPDISNLDDIPRSLRIPEEYVDLLCNIRNLVSPYANTNLTIEDLFGNYRYYLEANWIKEWAAYYKNSTDFLAAFVSAEITKIEETAKDRTLVSNIIHRETQLFFNDKTKDIEL